MFTRSKRFLTVCSVASLLVTGFASAGSAASAQSWSLYNQSCFACHGISKQGKSPFAIQNAVNNVVSMSSMKSLAAGQIAAIAAGR
ncbi:hypothetical protein [Pelotalea chapellei]|uniref:Cytochrome c domain-containing protein n=1 Tax=Pelotalea chapellei TaxID=44671 RepID=A0ABS5U925_9BACT|nr:hypothetical protein [Pelotalea chapellei]MBT1072183.1 hypothetical protein [Pelotalea chapellei]